MAYNVIPGSTFLRSPVPYDEDWSDEQKSKFFGHMKGFHDIRGMEDEAGGGKPKSNGPLLPEQRNNPHFQGVNPVAGDDPYSQPHNGDSALYPNGALLPAIKPGTRGGFVTPDAMVGRFSHPASGPTAISGLNADNGVSPQHFAQPGLGYTPSMQAAYSGAGQQAPYMPVGDNWGKGGDTTLVQEPTFSDGVTAGQPGSVQLPQQRGGAYQPFTAAGRAAVRTANMAPVIQGAAENGFGMLGPGGQNGVPNTGVYLPEDRAALAQNAATYPERAAARQATAGLLPTNVRQAMVMSRANGSRMTPEQAKVFADPNARNAADLAMAGLPGQLGSDYQTNQASAEKAKLAAAALRGIQSQSMTPKEMKDFLNGLGFGPGAAPVGRQPQVAGAPQSASLPNSIEHPIQSTKEFDIDNGGWNQATDPEGFLDAIEKVHPWKSLTPEQKDAVRTALRSKFSQPQLDKFSENHGSLLNADTVHRRRQQAGLPPLAVPEERQHWQPNDAAAMAGMGVF